MQNNPDIIQLIPYEPNKSYKWKEICSLAKQYGRDPNADYYTKRFLDFAGNGNYIHLCNSQPHTHLQKCINPVLPDSEYGRQYSYNEMHRNFINGISDRDPDQDIANGILQFAGGNGLYVYRRQNNYNNDDHGACNTCNIV